MEHTWFSNEGLHVDHNRDRKNRIWSRFFDKPEAGGSSSIAPPKGGPTRRNVEDLLLKLDIDEDAEQANDAVEQMDWPQQVIYWKSIAAMNESLRRENENKFKDTPGTVGGIDVQYEGDVNKSLLFDEANKESEAPPTRRASPQPLFSDIHNESEDAPSGELPPPEASVVDKALEAEINEGEKVSPPAKELLTCTETGTQREGTGREITPAVEVPSAGDGETQTCIDTLREDTGMEIKQSENAPPPAIETSTDDDDAPIVFSRALNKRKRGATGARGKVAAAALLKRKRCKALENTIIEVGGEEEAQVQENNAELAPARLQSDPHSIWEKHMSSPMSSEEEMYRDKLNEGIPFPDGFIIKFLGDKDTFVHNYKQPVKLTESSLEKAIAIQAHPIELQDNDNGEYIKVIIFKKVDAIIWSERRNIEKVFISVRASRDLLVYEIGEGRA
ncbi:uncharacterized protein A4U43_C07F8020 [Asparagus officinalis]|uniref:Uncharacterized protein n=1 Tax=Asparagus officinalis TaxID=4686 RepID=A0A5P1EA62_ASPOF|nr:uncharacterized protein A4U43_C07F8020 [Asparagus officinalis]